MRYALPLLAAVLVSLSVGCDSGGGASSVQLRTPIPDTSVYVDAGAVEVLARDYFESNAAASGMTFEAESSDPSVVQATTRRSGSVALTPVQAGVAQVTVRAFGVEGGDASSTFTVTVLGSCPAGPAPGEFDLVPIEPGMSWRFDAEEESYVREFRDSFRGEWTVTLAETDCSQGVRTATFAAAFEGERGIPHPDGGTIWSPYAFDETLAYTESADGITFVLPGIVSGSTASFERYSTASSLEVLTTEAGRGVCIDKATFAAGVGLERRFFACYYGAGWGESTDHQRR